MADPVVRAVLRLEDEFTPKLDEFERRVNRIAGGASQRFDRMGNRFAAAADKAARGGRGIETALDRADRSARRTVGTIRNLALAAGGILGARGVVSTLIEFEQGLVGVGKTSDLTGADLDRLGDQIVALSQRVPVATTKLLEIAESAGQLGVSGSQNILRFTETIARLEASTNLAGSEGATALARILKVTGDGAEQVGRLGSAIVALGNSFATTEAEIAKTGQQIAQATASFRVSSTDVVGLSAAFASLGVRSELSASSLGRALRVIDGAAREGGAELRELTRITGLAGEALADLIRTDPAQAFVSFSEGLGRAIGRGEAASEILERLGLGGEELARVLPTVASRFDLLADGIAKARREAERNEALVTESSRAFDTLGSRLQVAGNTITAVIASFRGSNGALSDLVDTGSSAIAILGGVASESQRADESAQSLARGIEAVAAGVGAFLAINAAGTIGRFGAAVLAASNPVTTLAVALGGVTGAAVLLSSRLSGVSDELREMREAAERAVEAVKGLERIDAELTVAVRDEDLERELRAVERRANELGSIKVAVQLELERTGADLNTESIPVELVPKGLSRRVDFFRAIAKRITGTEAFDALNAGIAKAEERAAFLRTKLDAVAESTNATAKPTTDLADGYEGLSHVIGPVVELTRRHVDALSEATPTLLATASALEAERAAREAALGTLGSSLSAVNERVELMRLEVAHGPELAQAISLANVARSAGIPVTRAAAEGVLALLQAETSLERTLSARQGLDRSLRALDERVRLLRVEATEGREAAEVARLVAEAREAGIEPTLPQVDAVRALVDEESRLRSIVAERAAGSSTPGVAEQVSALEHSLEIVGAGFSSTALRFVQEIAEGSEDALQNVGLRLLSVLQGAFEGILQGQIAGGLQALIGGDSKATGGVLSGGTFEKFARGGVPTLAGIAPGGVVSSRVRFLQSNGVPAEVGEAGREAVLPEFGGGPGGFNVRGRLPGGGEVPVPLSRLSGGRLGVDLEAALPRRADPPIPPLGRAYRAPSFPEPGQASRVQPTTVTVSVPISIDATTSASARSIATVVHGVVAGLEPEIRARVMETVRAEAPDIVAGGIGNDIRVRDLVRETARG